MQCVAVKDTARCHHADGHSGTHYALLIDDERTGKRASVKWPDDATTHIALTDTDFVPKPAVLGSARAYRAYVLQLQAYAAELGITIEQAERLVQDAKANHLAQKAGEGS